MKKLSKTEAIRKIEDFFKNPKNKTPKEVKKIKKLAASFNITLKEKRKTFCKRCFIPYIIPKIRIRNGFKIIKCDKCGFVAKWKIK